MQRIYMQKTGFGPTLLPKKTKILIVGTFPSEESLKAKEYYANNGNRFWKVIFKILKEDDPQDYKKRFEILNKYGICLWDIIKSCKRSGSSDTNIIKPTFNNLANYSSATILVNGLRSKKQYKHLLKFRNIIFLPSTSGNNTKYGLKKLIARWSKDL